MTAMNITTATNFAKVVALSSLLVVAGATQSRAGEGDVLGLLIGGAVLGTLLGSSFSGGLYDTTPDYRAERRHRHHRRHHQPDYRAERRHRYHRRHHHSRHAAYRSYDAPNYASYDAPAYAPSYASTYAPAYLPTTAPSPLPLQQTVAYDRYPNDYCRDYQSVVTINGLPQRSHGIACYRPDGSWRIIQ